MGLDIVIVRSCGSRKPIASLKNAAAAAQQQPDKFNMRDEDFPPLLLVSKASLTRNHEEIKLLFFSNEFE